MTQAAYCLLLFMLPISTHLPPLSHTHKMKQNSQVAIIILALLLCSHSGSARFLATQEEQVVLSDWMTDAGSSKEEDVLKLMGLEKCHENDEVCLKRRMAVEAHLDYIYTQHHNP